MTTREFLNVCRFWLSPVKLIYFSLPGKVRSHWKIEREDFFNASRLQKAHTRKNRRGDRHWVQMQKISQGTAVWVVCSFDASERVLFRVVFSHQWINLLSQYPNAVAPSQVDKFLTTRRGVKSLTGATTDKKKVCMLYIAKKVSSIFFNWRMVLALVLEYVQNRSLGMGIAGSFLNLLILWQKCAFSLESGKADLEKQESLVLVQRG